MTRLSRDTLPPVSPGIPLADTPSGPGEWTALAVGTAAALALGWYAVANPELLHLQVSFTPASVAAAGVGLVLIALVLLWPAFALTLLVAVVYLNLSDVLVRGSGLPSILQLLGLPVLISALVHHGPGLLHRVLGEPLTWLLAAYVLLLLASTTWAEDPILAEARFEAMGKALALYALLLLLVTTPGRLRVAVWTMVGAGALLGLLGFLQLSSGLESALSGLARVSRAHIYGDVFGLRLAGPLGDPNFFAQILLVLVPLALYLMWEERSRWAKLAAALCLMSILSASVLTYSRGGALALLFVVVASLVANGIRWRRILVVGLAMVAGTVILVPGGFRERFATIGQFLPDDAVLPDTDSSFQERLVLMGTAWEMMAANPVVGVGAGNYTARFGEYADLFGSTARDYQDPDDGRYTHNLYLEVGAETGTLGLGLFLGALLAAMVSLGRAREAFRRVGDARTRALARAVQISLMGYLISSLFLHGDFERYLWLLLGMAGALHAVGRLGAPAATRGDHEP